MENKKKKGAPIGNEFYKKVKAPTGRPRKYTPVGLWRAAVQYFDWITQHPLIEEKVFATGIRRQVKKMRPFTEIGFCLFAGIDRQTFINYKSGDEQYKDFFDIANRISDLIYSQKFEGAAVDFFNASIIARDLGLKDRQQFDFDFENMSDEQLDKVINTLAKKAHENEQKAES